jgi:hypothetical protein
MNGMIIKWVFKKLGMRECIWIEQAQIKVQWQVLMKSIMKVCVPTKAKTFLTIWATFEGLCIVKLIKVFESRSRRPTDQSGHNGKHPFGAVIYEQLLNVQISPRKILKFFTRMFTLSSALIFTENNQLLCYLRTLTTLLQAQRSIANYE